MIPAIAFRGSVTAAVPGTTIPNNTASPNANQFCLTWTSTGFTALTISFQGSDDGTTFSNFTGTGTVLVGSNPASTLSGAIVVQASATLAKVRANVTAVTGSGTISYQVYGYNGV